MTDYLPPVGSQQGGAMLGDILRRLNNLEQCFNAMVFQNGAWTTGYVPIWTQPGASPAYGSGTVVTTGYARAGRTMDARYQFQFGAGVNFGSGTNAWNFSTPFTPVVPASGFWNVGSWSALCAGTFYTGSVRMESGGVLGLFINNSAFSIHTTNPGTWVSGNYLQMDFKFEAAS